MDRNACTFVLFLLLSIKGLPITGQSENKTFIIPPDIPSLSPEASAVIKYTDYPVDPSSGIPEITVPIYTIQTGDITLPVTLTFHPSGLRPRESSGWVATGWTLNAAPSVVRKANGIPDGLNWNGYRGYLHNTDRGSYNQTYLKNLVEKGLNDETQDDYYYQLPHKSGKLFIRQLSNNAYKMIPESDKNILVTGLPTSGDIFGRITDGDGVAYLFEGMVEMSYYKSIQYPIRWLCTSVESSHYPHSNIGFEYTDFVSTYQETMQNMRGTMIVEDRIWKDGCSYSSYEMDPRFIIDPGSNVKKIYRLQKDTNGKTVYIDTYQTMDVESGYEGYGTPHDNTVRERKLKKIIFPHGSIEFVTSSDLLESIIVRNHEGEISKTVTLHTSRYNPYTELIKLDSVRVFDAGEGVKKYTFQYLSENYVPSKNTQAIDHWGYFNGQTDNNLNAVPKGYFNARHYSGNGFSLINGIANRESNGSAMQAGMLCHITDPQGVVTFFDYEANKIAICATPFTSGPWNTYEPFYYFKEVGGGEFPAK